MVNLNAIIKAPSSPIASKSTSGSGPSDAHAAGSFGDLLAQHVEGNPANPAVNTQTSIRPTREVATSTAGKTPGDKKTPAMPDATPNMPGDMLALLQSTPVNTPVEAKQVPAENAALTLQDAPDKKTVASTPAVGLYGNAAILPPQDIRNAVGNNNSSDAKTGKDIATKPDTNGMTNRANDLRATPDTAAAKSGKAQVSPAGESEFATKLMTEHTVKSADAMQIVTSHQVSATTTPDLASFAARSMLHDTSLASNSANAAQQTVNTPLGNAGWTDDFTQKINWMTTNQKDQVAELHLNPPDLGPLNVVLKVSDNQATATFTSPHSAVREAVENAIPKLREILADNGITLGNTTVSDQTPRDNGANASLDQRTRNPDGGWAEHGRRQSDTDTAPVPQASATKRHNGLVDTFV